MTADGIWASRETLNIAPPIAEQLRADLGNPEFDYGIIARGVEVVWVNEFGEYAMHPLRAVAAALALLEAAIVAAGRTVEG